MLEIREIEEYKGVLEYLHKRGLVEQFAKVKRQILEGYLDLADFKKRQPKALGQWYFRINRQYRAIGYLDGDRFTVVSIDDHHQ